MSTSLWGIAAPRRNKKPGGPRTLPYDEKPSLKAAILAFIDMFERKECIKSGQPA